MFRAPSQIIYVPVMPATGILLYNQAMASPFPGMDPYLEHPSLWPDVHNRLITAIADALAPQVAPDYYVRLERRAFLVAPDDLAFIGRPDVAVISPTQPHTKQTLPLAEAGVVSIIVPMGDEVDEMFLEVHDVSSGTLVTVLELLSPANKLHNDGREAYERKRRYIFSTRTNLVEIDLLRDGAPMPMDGKKVVSDYRIMVSRSSTRPRAQLYPFNLRQPIPSFHLPLLPGDKEPSVELNEILHDLYGRARYDLSLNYQQPPYPPLSEEDQTWAQEQIAAWTPIS